METGYITNIKLPDAILDRVGLLATAALLVAFFGIGGVLMRYRPEGDLKVIVMVVPVSRAVYPLVSCKLASAFELDRDPFRSVVLTAAMAPGASTYTIANMCGTARRVAASAVLISTLFSIVTIWFWLHFLP